MVDNSISFLKVREGGVCLNLKVQPRASKNEIGPPAGGELKIRVTAPPVDSAANQAVLELLSEKLKCARGAVRLIRGETSRHKIVWVGGMSAAQVMERLDLL